MNMGSSAPTLLASLAASLAAIAFVATSGCSTATTESAEQARVLVREEQRLGVDLASVLEESLEIRRSSDVSAFLRDVAIKLARSSGELNEFPIAVFIVSDRKEPWRNFGLPGTRLYLSSAMLKSLETESELAGALALELAHVARKHAVHRFLGVKRQGITAPAFASGAASVNEQGKAARKKWAALSDEEKRDRLANGSSLLGTGGAFDFTELEIIESVDQAVELLYLSGYDPRGLISYWERFRVRPSRFPGAASLVERAVERTYRAIGARVPLRNPIVRTEAFLAIQGKIRKL